MRSEVYCPTVHGLQTNERSFFCHGNRSIFERLLIYFEEFFFFLKIAQSVLSLKLNQTDNRSEKTTDL